MAAVPEDLTGAGVAAGAAGTGVGGGVAAATGVDAAVGVGAGVGARVGAAVGDGVDEDCPTLSMPGGRASRSDGLRMVIDAMASAIRRQAVASEVWTRPRSVRTAAMV